MGSKFAVAASIVSLFSCSAALGQVVARPGVMVPGLKPTIKMPGPAPAPASTGHSTIPARIRTASLTVTGTAAGAEPAQSPLVTVSPQRDFNLTVPLQISHLPAMYTDVEIDCVVTAAVNPQHPDPAALDHRVAEGMNSVHLVDGGYRGDVEVHPYTDAGYDPTTGQIYYCQANLVGNDRGAVFRAHPLRRYPTAPWTYEPPVTMNGTATPYTAGILP